MKISLIHPSRSRPEKSFDTISKWADRCLNKSQLQIIISLDADDVSSGLYVINYGHLFTDQITPNIISNRNKNAVQAINIAANFAKGDILIVVSDDTDCPMHWDKILLDAIGNKKDFVMKTDDGIQKRTCTMPIMDWLYYMRFGYIYNPIYSHSWADTELTEVAYALGRIIVRNDIVFHHLHPEKTGEPKDELYKRNDLTHDRDRPIYQQRKKINFGL